MKKFSLLVLVIGLFLLFPLMYSNAQRSGPQYVGYAKCKACHKKEYESWQKDVHFKAFESLKPGVKAGSKTKAKLDPQKDYSTDASCLSCHTTGYGKSAAAGAVLDNVQCEACHGPGSLYKSPKIMSKKKYKENREAQHKLAVGAGLITPDEKNCVMCHNKKSPTFIGFNYKKMVEKVKHKIGKK